MPTAIVTGATDGIGLHTALGLAKLGYRVGVHGRSQAKASRACAWLREQELGDFVPLSGDLSSLAQVRALAKQCLEKFPVLDVLVNNAGVFMDERVLTEDGLETTLAVNHFAHFLLTALLRPALEKADASRVVNVSSMAHSSGRIDLNDLTMKHGFDGYGAYSASKVANVLFTHALARRLEGTRVTTHALHPGVIDTKLLHKGFGAGGARVESGAKTSIYVATSPELKGKTGLYFSDAREVPCSRYATDQKLEEGLWAASEKLTGLSS
jgi:NAD(P)-dependent dehydrogenase (short-subunit alcohol dehydrogenase family)